MGDSSSTFILITIAILLLVMIGGGVVFTAVLCLRKRRQPGREEEEAEDGQRQRKRKAQKLTVKAVNNKHRSDSRGRDHKILGGEQLLGNEGHGIELLRGHVTPGRNVAATQRMEMHGTRGEEELPRTVIPTEPLGIEVTRHPGLEIVHTQTNKAYGQIAMPPDLPRNSSRGLSIHLQRNESYSPHMLQTSVPTGRQLIVERDVTCTPRNLSHKHGHSMEHNITPSTGRAPIHSQGRGRQTSRSPGIRTEDITSDEICSQISEHKNEASLVDPVGMLTTHTYRCSGTENHGEQKVLMRRNQAYDCIKESSQSGSGILLWQHTARRGNGKEEMEMVRNEAYTAIAEREEEDDYYVV